MEWRTIKGYEGYYEVSDTGSVRALDRIVPSRTGVDYFRRGHIMKLTEFRQPGREGPGYLVVNLRKYHTCNVARVHRLVAEAFLPNPLGLPTVNHKDGDKQNNHLDNLEWASYATNNVHALRHELRHPRGNPIAQYDLEGNLVATYRSSLEAERATGITYGGIIHCLHGRTHTSGGYIWKQLERCNDYPENGSTTEDELPSEVQEQAEA